MNKKHNNHNSELSKSNKRPSSWVRYDLVLYATIYTYEFVVLNYNFEILTITWLKDRNHWNWYVQCKVVCELIMTNTLWNSDWVQNVLVGAMGFDPFCVQSSTTSASKILVEKLLQEAILASLCSSLALLYWSLFLLKCGSSVPTGLQPCFFSIECCHIGHCHATII